MVPQITNHRLIATLGRGGMADVYLSLSSGMRGFQKLVVLKVLMPELAADSEQVEMFLREARLAALLNHPNVVATHEVGEDDGRPYLAMEHLDGQPLSAALHRRGREVFPLHLHVFVIAEMLAGLHYAHGAVDLNGAPLGIIHRDVSPQNVFVTYSGQVKLLDFGIAKSAGSGSLTRYGIIKGKVGYFAPEQALGTEVDRRADVFAAGVMLWEAIMRARLVPLTTDDAVALRQRVGGTHPAPTGRDERENALAAICCKAMATVPAERYETAASLRDALLAWLGESLRSAPAELGDLLSKDFEKDRLRLRETIERQVAESTKVADLSLMNLALGSGSGSLSPVVRRSASSPALPRAQSTGSIPSAATVSRASGRRALWITLSGAALVVALVAASRDMTRRSAQSLPHDTTESAQSNEGAPAPPALPPDDAKALAGEGAPPLPATPQARTHRLRVSVTPKTAVATLDGEPVKLPLDVRLSPDGAERTLRLSARGHGAETRVLRVDNDTTLELALRPIAGRGAAQKSAPTPPPEGGGATARRDLPIDEANPYSASGAK